VLGRGPAARAVGADRVVRVLSVRHRVESVLGQQFGIDRGEQLVLAVEAAVGTIGDIAGALTLPGLDLDHRHADLTGHLMRRGPFLGSQAG
jgi:hypothetical protein